MSPLSSPSLSIDVKEGDKNVTIHLQGPSQAGLLCSLTSAFISLGLDVKKADITEKDGAVDNMFQVAKEDGTTVSDEDVAVIRQTLESLLASASSSSATRSRPKLRVRGAAEGNKGELLHELMDTYSTDSVLSIQRAIINHVEYTLARSRYVALRCIALHCIALNRFVGLLQSGSFLNSTATAAATLARLINLTTSRDHRHHQV